MLGDLVKILELLLNTMKGKTSAEARREAFAKEMFQLYLQIEQMVDRGKKILSVPPTDDPAVNRISVELLSAQIQAVADIQSTLSVGMIGDILRLHLPKIKKDLSAIVEYKAARVWVRMDQLLGDGEAMDPKQWVDNMESVLVDGTRAVTKGKDLWLHMPEEESLKETIESPRGGLMTYEEGDGPKKYRYMLMSDPMQISEGHRVLKMIESANMQLRTFLIDKFHFEDLL